MIYADENLKKIVRIKHVYYKNDDISFILTQIKFLGGIVVNRKRKEPRKVRKLFNFRVRKFSVMFYGS